MRPTWPPCSSTSINRLISTRWWVPSNIMTMTVTTFYISGWNHRRWPGGEAGSGQSPRLSPPPGAPSSLLGAGRPLVQCPVEPRQRVQQTPGHGGAARGLRFPRRGRGAGLQLRGRLPWTALHAEAEVGPWVVWALCPDRSPHHLQAERCEREPPQWLQWVALDRHETWEQGCDRIMTMDGWWDPDQSVIHPIVNDSTFFPTTSTSIFRTLKTEWMFLLPSQQQFIFDDWI